MLNQDPLPFEPCSKPPHLFLQYDYDSRTIRIGNDFVIDCSQVAFARRVDNVSVMIGMGNDVFKVECQHYDVAAELLKMIHAGKTQTEYVAIKLNLDFGIPEGSGKTPIEKRNCSLRF